MYTLVWSAGRLSVDDRLERDHVTLDEVGYDALR